MDSVRIAVVVLAALALLFVVWRLRRRRKRKLVEPRAIEPLDVGSLSEAGPPPSGPVLEFHYLPVRLAAVVLAPAGRGAELPPRSDLDFQLLTSQI